MIVIAFHEKAGRSQVDSFVFSLDKVFLFLPSGHCRHASIRTLEERFHFARCMLGVLVTAGAAICLSPCGSALPSRTWARPLTQSPELGFGFVFISSWNGFDFCFVFRSTRLPRPWFGCCCAMVRTLLRSPTGDAAAPPAFLRWRRSLASSRSSRRVRPVSVPSAADHSRCRMVPRCAALPAPAACADTDPLPC